MKFHISTMALAMCVFGAISAQAQTSTSVQTESSTKTTVIPGKDDTTIVLRPEGQPPAVIDVNQDILGKSPKKSADATKDATPDAKQGTHATNGTDAKSDMSVNAKSTVDEKTTSETTGEGTKAECVTKTGKETKSVNSTKATCE